jgi:flagellar hook protein FlgE
MGLMNAMDAGASGMNAEGQALGVVGDNLANTNTVGFKESRAVFEDVLGGAVGSNGAGAGVRMARSQQIFAQGALLSTGQPTDLALSGDGFFVVKGTIDGVSGDFYTRAGQTSLSASGQVVNPDGLPFEGYAATGKGTFSPQTGPIQVSTAALKPSATSALTITANLDSTATAPAAAFDPQNPATTSNFSTTMSVYDSLGNAHQVNVYFDKNASGGWDYHALANGSEVAGGTPGQNTEIAGGTLTFDSSGALQSQTTTGGTVSFNGAAPNQPLTMNFGTPIAAGGTGLGGTTQFASPSAVSSQSQDGYASGALTGITVDGNGVVDATYDNGQQIAVAQLAIAKFQSNDGLGRAGHNLWTATQDSGAAALGTAGSGGRASVVSGSLEQSNVDIASQFVDMISHQRAFQADSKTITTVDEMLQDLVNLKH